MGETGLGGSQAERDFASSREVRAMLTFTDACDSGDTGASGLTSQRTQVQRGGSAHPSKLNAKLFKLNAKPWVVQKNLRRGWDSDKPIQSTK